MDTPAGSRPIVSQGPLTRGRWVFVVFSDVDWALGEL